LRLITLWRHLVTFQLKDFRKVDLSGATVVTLYLRKEGNLALRPVLTRQLKPGARIVSHHFSLGDWEPDKVETFQDRAGHDRTLYLWTADGIRRRSASRPGGARRASPPRRA
jgi:hypothetical protein